MRSALFYIILCWVVGVYGVLYLNVAGRLRRVGKFTGCEVVFFAGGDGVGFVRLRGCIPGVQVCLEWWVEKSEVWEDYLLV